MVIVAIIVSVLTNILLILYNLSLSKKITVYKNAEVKMSHSKVVQDFMDTIGSDMPVDDKIRTINDIIIEKYNIKYSTIVVFNGAEYILKASNVDEKFWDVLKNLHNDEMFKDSIMTATPKYVTINNANERLTYQKTEMGRAKSAMFFPLYIDNIYIGYWIIESEQMHAFDNMDTSILGVIKDNIISVLKTVSYQTTIENIYREDVTTGLNSAEYIYGKGKIQMDKFDQSTVCMFTINNIEEINEEFGRDIGTEVIKQVVEVTDNNISDEYIFVRYLGPKFIIVFTGTDSESVVDFVKNIKEEVENIKVNVGEEDDEDENENENEDVATPILNFVMATYYKGTGIEEITKKLEKYLNDADKEESDIVCI